MTSETAQLASEEAVLQAGALQSAIFNSANFSSIATDAKGVIQIFNVGAQRMLGYSADEVVNRVTPADISDPHELVLRARSLSAEFSAAITPGFEALVFKASRGIEDIYELTYLRRDGTRLPAVVSVTALRDDRDLIIGYLLIGTDNTARKQIEAEQQKRDQRLRDQQFYTRSLIESHLDALVITNPLGIITDVNRQMESLTGCTRDELIGSPFRDCFTNPTHAEAGIERVLRDKRVTDYELTARARDGRTTQVSYNATTFFDRERKLLGVFAAARDVTDRQRNAQAMQAANTELASAKLVAETANLAKSDFLSSMSHELRSPLNAILGFAQLMQSDPVPPTSLQQESLEQILQAGWHLLKLIDEILDLSVIESGRMSLSTEPVSLGEVLAECQAMMAPEGALRGISMTFPLFEAPLFVVADRTRLKQVLINLLSNAVKYNVEHGTVVVDFHLHLPGRLRVTVRDSGVGLASTQVSQLFQPFNRLGQQAAGGVAGTGIGLVVTKRLVELMGGSLGVTSSLGLGSQFWFELQRCEAPQIEHSGGTEDEPHGATLPAGAELHSLLYVEDNDANMKLVERIISRRPDVRLITAVNAPRGLELARSQRPTVILMDLNLPGMSGVDALKALRADPLTRHIPVVALSANAMTKDIQSCLDAGFFRYLTKPIKIREFTATLNAAFELAQVTK